MTLQICWKKLFLAVVLRWWPFAFKKRLAWGWTRVNASKSADEKGWLQSWYQCIFDDLFDFVLELVTDLLHSPELLVDWYKTMISMLPRHGRAKVPAESRPIASTRLLYRTCICFMLGRGGSLGSRSAWRTTSIFDSDATLKKTWWSVTMPIWVTSLDWPNPLIACVGRHFGMLYPNKVSNHMIWMI